MPETQPQIGTLLAARLADRERDGADAAALDDRRELFMRLVAEHHGRSFRTPGDSLVARFPNAVDSLRCAVAAQRAFLAANEPLEPEHRILLRIGLHIGDFAEGDGVLDGEGVEIADRLAALAVPGGICLSRAVHDQVRRKADVRIEYAGNRPVGTAFEPVEIYQVAEPGVDKGYFSIWAELQRRNVFRAGAAYAVVGWLLMQVAAIVYPAFDAPRWAMQATISVLIVGFPVALVLAWVYEITPMGLKRSDQVLRQASIARVTGRRVDRVIIGLLAIVVAVLIFDNYVPLVTEGTGTTESNSIAVLAFENRSTDPNDEYFADGLADELLSVLSRIPELKVASRTASFYYKGRDTGITEIASTLMVGNVLSGTVQRDGDRIRVTAALDDAESGDLLWSETYQRRFEDIFEIQSDIAQSVATAIVPVLSPESGAQIRSKPTENAEAYDFYLRGRDYLRQPAEESTLASAVGLFDRAIELDPRFAQAYAGLCEAQLGNYEFTSETEYFQKAEDACTEALSLNDSLWEVRVALGNLYRIDGQNSAAVRELEAAIAQQPNAVDAYLALSRAYEADGQLDQAEAMLRRAESLESGYWGVHRAYGNFLYRTFRLGEALERHEKVIELTPDSGIGYDNVGNIYLALGRLDEAEAAFNASPLPSRWTYTNRGLVYWHRGEFEKAIEDQRKAIELAPDYQASWGRLGDAYRGIAGDEEQARDAYLTAIRLVERDLAINPTDWDGASERAQYYAFLGRDAEAKAQIEEVLRHTSDPDAYYSAAVVSLHGGDPDRALDYLEMGVAGGLSRALLTHDPNLTAIEDTDRFRALTRPGAD